MPTIQDHFQKTLQALLPVVHSRAKILDQLVAPSFPRAIPLQVLRLTLQVFFLVVARDSGISYRQIGFELAKTQQVVDFVVARATLADTIG